ncbi:STAS domain-containing protein [Pseudooceanicola sp. CBS1P-1]|uniref:STAS domain-containing protein n=1 Tax=Pseudooceanicola albus TaxID=2692189 RepID=A0A6L7FX53_9RHOB|nr:MULTISPECIES: STAS domain-containing protein [Pseudooceanicola]MBT9383256.1 STAS domain-containing protein [Pseudooceanicola endophyticus]MXN16421.1 STAS domain-containing protein [Pseudooceanicola albus]
MTAPLVLPPKLDLPAAGPLAEALRARLDGDLEVDAGEVTHLGALCLQVLLSAATSLRAGGHAMTIRHASDRLLEQMSQMGFTPETLAEGREWA